MSLNIRPLGQKTLLLANVGEVEIRLLLAHSDNAWEKIKQKSDSRNTNTEVIFIHNDCSDSLLPDSSENEVYPSYQVRKVMESLLPLGF